VLEKPGTLCRRQPGPAIASSNQLLPRPLKMCTNGRYQTHFSRTGVSTQASGGSADCGSKGPPQAAVPCESPPGLGSAPALAWPAHHPPGEAPLWRLCGDSASWSDSDGLGWARPATTDMQQGPEQPDPPRAFQAGADRGRSPATGSESWLRKRRETVCVRAVGPRSAVGWRPASSVAGWVTTRRARPAGRGERRLRGWLSRCGSYVAES
jgi:hypothetical protein